MSPEAIEKRVYSFKSDIWSYGILCIEVLTRDDPYPGINLVEVGCKFVVEKNLILKNLNSLFFFSVRVVAGTLSPQAPSLTPNEFVELLERCWEREPDNRPDATTIKFKLEEILKNDD